MTQEVVKFKKRLFNVRLMMCPATCARPFDKVPSGLLPAVEIDGKLMTESLDIMQMLAGSSS
jgi:glutathione S-transferase